MSSSTVVEKGLGMVPNGPNWPKIAQKGSKWPQSNPKLSLLSIWYIWAILWTFLAILVLFRRCWAFLDHFGPSWTILGHFGPFFHNSTGAHIDAQKLKHGLDRQMSAHMAQENHKQNLKIKNNVGIKVVYFISLFLDDTVVR